MIKAVFLDAGGTLLHAFPSVGGVYSNVAARHGVTVDAELLDARFKNVWKVKRALRRPVEKKWWREVVTDVFDGQKFGDFEAFFEDVYAAFAQKESWRVFDDVVPALTELKKRSLQVAVLSNWDERLPGLLKLVGLEPYFDKQFVSFQLGLAKPNPLFFKHALSEMGLHASEVIHVGDDLEEDVQGAQSAGIRAYHLARNTRPLSSRTITTLEEIFVRI